MFTRSIPYTCGYIEALFIWSSHVSEYPGIQVVFKTFSSILTLLRITNITQSFLLLWNISCLRLLNLTIITIKVMLVVSLQRALHHCVQYLHVLCIYACGSLQPISSMLPLCVMKPDAVRETYYDIVKFEVKSYIIAV